MDTKAFYGVITVDEQKYALPLNEILGIESTAKVKKVNGTYFLLFQDQEVALYDLITSGDQTHSFRKLSVILKSEPIKAIQVDAFNSIQLKKDKIKQLPEIMIDKSSIIKDVLYDEETHELLLMLTRESLIKYLDYK